MKQRILLLLLSVLPPVAGGQTLSGLKFCIDPGHGGFNPANDRHIVPDPGNDFWESESNFRKALVLKAMLEANGATVLLTRTTNDETTVYPDHPTSPVFDPYEPSLSARAQIANDNNVNWFHSIHSNAFNQVTNYTLILFRGYDNQPVFPEAKTMGGIMAQLIGQFLRTDSYQNRGDWTFYGSTLGLGVLRPLNMPGQLSEGSFHDVFPETRRLLNKDYRKMEAHALLRSFMNYYVIPVDTLGIIGGIQLDNITGKPKNQTVVRLLPENRIYTGDSFNNGFYMFDSLAPGSHKLVFETPRYEKDSVDISITGGTVLFVDRTLMYASFPFVTGTTLTPSDTAAFVQSPITIRFSTPMDSALVRQALSLSPTASGTLAWTADLKNLSFSPSPPLDYLTRYALTIDSSARSANGYSMDIDGDGFGGDSYSLVLRTEPPLTAQSIAFGQVKKGDTSSADLKIHNRASYAVVVKNLTNSTSQFWTSATLPDTIAGNDSLVVDVFFRPVSFGSFSDALVVSPDSGAIKVPLTGSSPAPNLVPSHTILGFGSVELDTSFKRFFFLTTSSVNGVRVDSVYTKTPAFRISFQGTLPLTLSLFDTLHSFITFFPQVLGTQFDTLFITNNTATSLVKVILLGNGATPTGVTTGAGIVDRFDLLQNFPNPFNPLTRIEFHIAETSPVRLEIVDMLGRTVRVLASGTFEPGSHHVEWDGANDDSRKVASGVYFYRLSAGSYISSRKMILLK